MGCRSDYLEATSEENYSRETAKLVVFAAAKLGQPVEARITKAAAEYYGDKNYHNEITAALCALCTSMTDAQKDAIIYNGRDETSRLLATWWDKHVKDDAKREADEAEDAKFAALAAKIEAAIGPEGIAKLKEAFERKLL
jgi:hypothetical protein